MFRYDPKDHDFFCDNRCCGCYNPCPPPRPPRCCCIGPTGATGAAGATILGSYATYAEFIAAHPTGTAGDAYLVGGVLYVWNAGTASWQNIGSLIGPTGATGAAGATILGSYATLAELIAAHPTGTAGDAYLVGGELYVWGGDPASWQRIGSLVGPTGATEPVLLGKQTAY